MIQDTIASSLYDDIVDTAGSGLCLYELGDDEIIRPLFLSSSMGTLSGETHEVFEERQRVSGSFSAVHPADKAFLLETIHAVVSKGETISLSYRNYHAKEKYFWVSGGLFQTERV